MASRSVIIIMWMIAAVPAHGGEIVDHVIESEALQGNLIGASASREFSVYLPDGYEKNDQTYPVVFHFPGYSFGRMDYIDPEAIDLAIASGRAPPVIIVFMEGLTRFGSTVYFGSRVFGDWESFLFSEIIPFIDVTYNTAATPHKRGVIGFSGGGFAALTLQIRHPYTFGAIGLNDPSLLLVPTYVRDPENFAVDAPDLMPPVFTEMPESIEGFTTGAVPAIQVAGQIGASISPNLSSPLFADFPKDENGEWVPQVRQKWRDLDIADPAVIDKHKNMFVQFSAISIVVPDSNEQSNRAWNLELIDNLEIVGISVNSISSPGSHFDHHNERFIALLEDVSKGLDSAQPFEKQDVAP